MSTPSRIAIWNTAFLGDAVLTLPLARVVKAAFPEAAVDLYVRRGLAPLFSAQPELHAVFDPEKRLRARGLWQLVHAIRSRAYDIWISPHASPRSALIARLSGAGTRIGFSGCVNALAYDHVTPRGFGEQDEIERVLNLTMPLFKRFPNAAPAGFDASDPANPWHWPNLVLPFEALADADAFIASLPGRGPLLGIHPGSVWPTKRWMPERFAAVGRLALDAGARIVLLAAKAERAEADAVLDAGLRGREGVIDACGAFDLPRLAAVIARLDAYLTNDSGPMHLAWCQHVPVTAVFGPTVRGFGFAPRGEFASLIEAPTDPGCRPCSLHGPKRCPKGHFGCMADITPDQVWRNLEPKLARSRRK